MADVRAWSILRIKQHRYAVVEMESKSEYYLVDLDAYSYWLGYLFPVFNWVVSHKVMKINLSAEEVNSVLLNKELSEEYKRKDLSTAAYIAIAVISPRIFRPILDPIFENWGNDFTIYTNYVLVFSMLLILLLLKVHLSTKDKKVLELVGADNLSEVKARLYPTSFKQGFKISVVPIILALFTFGFFWLFILSNLWFAYITGSFMFFGLLVLNEFKLGVPDGFKMKVLD